MGECLDIISGNGVFLPSNVGNKATTNDQHRLLLHVSEEIDESVPEDSDEYLSVDTKLSHRVHDAQKCWNSLCLLSNLGLVDFQLEVVEFEVFLDLVSVYIVDIHISHGQYTAPTLVAFC